MIFFNARQVPVPPPHRWLQPPGWNNNSFVPINVFITLMRKCFQKESAEWSVTVFDSSGEKMSPAEGRFVLVWRTKFARQNIVDSFDGKLVWFFWSVDSYRPKEYKLLRNRHKLGLCDGFKGGEFSLCSVSLAHHASVLLVSVQCISTTFNNWNMENLTDLTVCNASWMTKAKTLILFWA